MSSGKSHLAQVNIARMKAPLDDLIMAEFVAALDEINALADRSPGFVWRLQSDAGNATDLRPYNKVREFCCTSFRSLSCKLGFWQKFNCG